MPQGDKSAYTDKQRRQAEHIEDSERKKGRSKEDAERIFESFQRGSDTPSVPGTGLGLAIARWIADAHSIELSLTSELGKGTRIQLRIPLAVAVPVKDV